MALKKVLIVEDSFLIAESLAQTVAAMGFDVVGRVNTADGALRKRRRLLTAYCSTCN